MTRRSLLAMLAAAPVSGATTTRPVPALGPTGRSEACLGKIAETRSLYILHW
jgi:hypothetical protein